MNRDDIIRMAKEADFNANANEPYNVTNEWVFRFAALVASAEREFYMQLFLDPENQPTQFGTATQEYREQEVREAKRQERDEFKEHALAMARAAIIGAVKNEREACAKVADTISDKYGWGHYGNEVDTADEIAKAIRARGQA